MYKIEKKQTRGEKGKKTWDERATWSKLQELFTFTVIMRVWFVSLKEHVWLQRSCHYGKAWTLVFLRLTWVGPSMDLAALAEDEWHWGAVPEAGR
jgi:hypothetical protein